jgi:hypothetical protein
MATKRDDTETRALLSRLEERLGLPNCYITSDLREEPNDWTFIVKLAVLVEAAVTKVVVANLGREEMYDHVSRLANAQRLDLALTLGVLEKSDVRTLKAVAEVRNAFAHKVENLKHDLASFWRALNPQMNAHLMDSFLSIKQTKGKLDFTQAFYADGTFFRGLIFNLTLFPLISLAKTDKKTSEREKGLWASSAGFEKWAQGSFKMATGLTIVPGNHDIDIVVDLKKPTK